MAIYLIGDVQGCDEALERLLLTVGFSPSRDHVFLLGDLVNRGPQSCRVLRRLMHLEASATCLLGNHDLSLLAMAHGVRKPHRTDTAQEVLQAPDRDALLHWLRHQKLAEQAHGWLMVHAGVLPQWDATQTMALAAEVEAVLRGPRLPEFLGTMFGNEPDRWDDALLGPQRWRLIANVLTRLRFCTPDGRMEFKESGGPQAAPPGMLPWFDAPGRRTGTVRVAFGHWSTLGLLARPNLLSLDTGCVWGGCLSGWRIDAPPGEPPLVQIQCIEAQRSGQ